MVQKSFKTFLEQYCSSLCGVRTSSLRTFASMLLGYPRLKEPLLLLAIVQGRESYLVSSVTGLPVSEEYALRINDFKAYGGSIEDYLKLFDDDNRYKKCYLSWLSENGRLERDRALLAKVSVRMNELIREKGIDRASACRIAGLNKGNFYAFLKGDTTKLSRKTAISAYDEIARLA